MANLTEPKARIQSIDLLRGIVIVIMALDHVRDFFHIEGATGDPTNMDTTSPMLFFTRWITHFCAPVFVFLAGTSGFLQGLRKSKKELSLFLIKRGLWLVLAEVVLITFGITFDPGYHTIILQVIWAIGTSMIILGLLVWLPFPLILFYGFAIFFFHNLLDPIEARRGQDIPLIWKMLHSSFYFHPFDSSDPTRGILGIYAVLPWSGIMTLGYCFGKFFRREVDPTTRRKALLLIGSGLILLFVVLRFINEYGDSRPWSEQPRGGIYTFLSFFNTNKYPPSLMYACMTLGPAIIVLALIEKIQNGFTRFFVTYGRVPFFFYILHFYLIHLVCMVFFFADGRYGSDDIVPKQGPPLYFRPADFGFNLWGTYAVWIAIVLALYPLCRMYDRYKTNKPKWWTSYL